MINGKGFFIWRVTNAEGGDVAAIVSKAKSAGLTHLLIKIADGIEAFNVDQGGNDLVAPLVNALQAEGIQAWGWHFVYGDKPAEEAQMAIQRVGETGVVGYVVNAESHYKEAGKAAAAETFMSDLRDALPVFPVGLSSYRYPSLHTELPWEEFLGRCNYALPQVYWIHANDPKDQLERSISEYREMTTLPIIPTGAAFAESGWEPTTVEVIEFLNAARDNNLSGANFWEWAEANQLPNMWQTIADYNWPTFEQPPPVAHPVIRGTVWASALNVRSGPGSDYPVVGALKFGTRVTLYDLHRAWVKISEEEEQWVYSYYLNRLD